MSPWRWWVGHTDEVDAEGVYSIDDCETREEAILIGLRETQAGKGFRIIEARTSEDARHEGAEVTPFLRRRNGERFIKGPQGDALIDKGTKR